jgi:predicted nucleotide-binding protein
MARKSGPTTPPSKTLSLQELEAAIRKIERRILELKEFDVASIKERWDARAGALEKKINATLAEIFGEETAEFNRYRVGSFDSLPIVMGGGNRYSVPEIQKSYREGIDEAVVELESLLSLLRERLEDHGNHAAAAPAEERKQIGRRIFIVHGRDDAAKETVARFIDKLRLEPIILHEQPNAGRTIIEKLEGHLDVDFAVVLLTPDDVGALATAPDQVRPRARQNVVLELGLFLAALSRRRVCALHRGDVELPSDYDGVVYIPMDDAGGWRLLLAREIKHAGLEIDLNLAV